MMRQRIYSFKINSLNETDRLNLATLLIKAGYAVKISKAKLNNSNSYTYYVEYWEDSE